MKAVGKKARKKKIDTGLFKKRFPNLYNEPQSLSESKEYNLTTTVEKVYHAYGI